MKPAREVEEGEVSWKEDAVEPPARFRRGENEEGRSKEGRNLGGEEARCWAGGYDPDG